MCFEFFGNVTALQIVYVGKLNAFSVEYSEKVDRLNTDKQSLV